MLRFVGCGKAGLKRCLSVTLHEPQLVRHGALKLDLAQSRRTGADGDKDLRPKSFALQCHLVHHAGTVLTKDAGLGAVWPDVTVTEDSLTRCEHDIRRCLGDADARMLRTVPRRGYLLVFSNGTGWGNWPLRRHGRCAITRRLRCRRAAFRSCRLRRSRR